MECEVAVQPRPDVVAMEEIVGLKIHAVQRNGLSIERSAPKEGDQSGGRIAVDGTADACQTIEIAIVDLRLLFAATRAAKRVEPKEWPRMLELLIDALDSRPRTD